jgi:hypothetical protein
MMGSNPVLTTCPGCGAIKHAYRMTECVCGAPLPVDDQQRDDRAAVRAFLVAAYGCFVCGKPGPWFGIHPVHGLGKFCDEHMTGKKHKQSWYPQYRALLQRMKDWPDD